ncbi:DUF4031 domain-containing protein [Zhihengliuella halotolerans]|uniref:Putative metal-dependent HD superfamily phosphohydrolase n=1 Tax=Zhihengliuella halotolerans TaxID=370736 RepID=A0A4Q8AAM5_9MICC|nr:DUF4031 domain-containing protein [Zhihengliuella halotolerans]RZU60595.1 putative metal-dependent HD superfamily phosphohydrolase [Zhihengliuella halotolerans]
MSILIDPPLWPAHGTLFSHVVSDASLDELHEFASVAGLPARAFDRDHYDVPQRRYEDLVARGATPVSGTELVRRLVASGLRVPARQRPEKLDRILLTRWSQQLPDHPHVGADLLARWSEPHRNYHGRGHLLAVLAAVDLLVAEGEPAGAPPRAVHLAAWFHDAVYQGIAGQDERASAELVRLLLPGAVGDAELEEIRRLVLVTEHHSPSPDDASGRLLCDADLEVLARPWPQYLRYVEEVRRDYAQVSDADFARGRARVVRSLLELDPLYGTGTGRRLWETAARANLARELESLQDGTPVPSSR